MFPRGPVVGCLLSWAVVVQCAAQSPWRRVDLGAAALAAARAESNRLTAVAVCPGNTNLLLATFSLGGIHRSADGGATWQISMTGWNAPGAGGFAFDPVNPAHVVAWSAGTAETRRGHGLYESFDTGETWRLVDGSTVGFEGRFVFEPDSFDRDRGACQRVWRISPGGEIDRSTDGARTWRRMRTRDNASGTLVCDAKGRHAYLFAREGPNRGVYRYRPGPDGFELMFRGAVEGLAVSPAAPDFVWLIHDQRIWISGNGGGNFVPSKTARLPAGEPAWGGLSVSPFDARRMLAVSAEGRVWFTSDGGVRWSPLAGATAAASSDAGTFGDSVGWLTSGGVWVGGDGEVWFGSPGGAALAWRTPPAAQPSVGGGFQFMPDAATILIGLRHGGLAVSPDAGKSWEVKPLAPGQPGGAVGAFAADTNRFFAGYAQGEGGRQLKVSGDGGKSWAPAHDPVRRVVGWSTGDTILAHPTNSQALFAPGWRSLSGGASWGATPSCHAVYTFGTLPPYPVVGRLDTALMISTNFGDSWRMVTPVSGGFTDVALDQTRSRAYFASQGTVKVFQAGQWAHDLVPADQFGRRHFQTVAVDPVDPNVVYAGGRAPDYVTDVPVVRSVDGGRNWHNFIPKLGQRFLDGPREVTWLRVHPATRELWVGTRGFGVWVASPPTSSASSK